jgi:hypothetical protein
VKTTALPPFLAEIVQGSVTWQEIEGIDHEFLGYFLSCHLIIEHYLDQYLRIMHPKLNWGAARHSFSQKVALLSEFKINDQYDCIPAIKHMNSLRNKLSHDIQFTIRTEDLLPLTQYLVAGIYKNGGVVPTEPRLILEQFTMMSCVLFASFISGFAQSTKLTIPPTSRK